MQNTCLILLSYMECVTPDMAQELAESADYIIAADGGQNRAREFGLQPDCVIGDFDSTTLNEDFDCLYITYPAEKDLTDTEAALTHALEKGCRNVILLGGMGGRLDHTMGNIGLLDKYYSAFDYMEFIDGKNKMELLKDSGRTLKRDARYKYFGLVSLNAEASGIDIRGAKYELTGASLERASTLGVSNEFSEDTVEIYVREGTLLIVRSADR
ncbi:MAG: thiamine diphosphokinase [Clostridia bacterium]|nr:thiamine diphosphokinase [Clostridia bacterium]